MLRQATTLGVFNDIKAWVAMYGQVRRRDGGYFATSRRGKFKDKLWATALHLELAGHPGEQGFRRLLRAVGPPAELFGGMHLLGGLRVEGGGREGWLLKTADVIQALEGLELSTPAGKRVYRREDHQAVYNVPAGRVTYNKEVAPIAHLTDLKVFPASDYFRNPPFN
jgi:branched-chain amino acid transport system substrate-binding protein